MLHFTLLYFTLLYFTLLYFTLLYFTLLYFTLLVMAIALYSPTYSHMQIVYLPLTESGLDLPLFTLFIIFIYSVYFLLAP